MSVTIYDIADRAGVSIATVSRVLNRHPRVSEKTRARVFSVAEELGYQPHVSARSLARQNTQLVAAVVPMMTSYFFMEVIRGIQDRLASSEYDLLVYASRSMEAMDDQMRRAAQKGRADGVLVCSTPLDDRQVDYLSSVDVPCVLVDAFHGAFDSVSVDNRRGGYVATQHLLAQGYRRVALIMAHPHSVPARDRREGYEAALAEAGLDLDSQLVHTSADDDTMHGYTRESGYTAMNALLALPDPPDAVFAASDVQALGALKALREAGLRAPSDLALCGFDDIRTSAYVGLSTVRQPMYEMGKLAVEKLRRRLDQPNLPPSHTSFAPRLVMRETTASPGDAPRGD
ncbi:MAG: LacI family DNA-binding transcriptional regulator [Bacteroidota bacterium]